MDISDLYGEEDLGELERVLALQDENEMYTKKKKINFAERPRPVHFLNEWFANLRRIKWAAQTKQLSLVVFHSVEVYIIIVSELISNRSSRALIGALSPLSPPLSACL